MPASSSELRFSCGIAQKPRKNQMAKTTPRPRRTIDRVTYEFEHGELKSGGSGKAGSVKSRKKAIAIALNEAGASQYKSEAENQRSRVRSERKEAEGKTYQQEAEGKSHVGARGRRESTPAMRAGTKRSGSRKSRSRKRG
jgi:hypothetical protein